MTQAPGGPPATLTYPCDRCGARLEFAAGTMALRCPYCGHEMDIDDMLACPDADLFRITTDEESACINCPSCDAEYWVAGSYTPHYHCAKTEDEL